MELETEGKSRGQGRLTAALGVCLLYNEHIAELFALAEVGTQVRIF